MCGIVACLTPESAVDHLLVALRRLEYRGYDSMGMAVQKSGGGTARFRTAGRIEAMESLVRSWSGPALGGIGIGHTRWATHGAVTEANAHPHSDCHGRINLVHNGVITNARKLRGQLEHRGHRFASTVDSEVLCHLIEEHLDVCGDLGDAVRSALTEVKGSWAIAVLEAATGRIVVSAHRSPLLLAHTRHGAFATSDIAAVADWVEDFRVVEWGEVVDLGNTGSFSPGEKILLPAQYARRSQQVNLNGYTDYMGKEIDEQPEAAARVIDECASRVVNGTLWKELNLPPFERLQVLGCGTSLNAGRAIGNLVRGLAMMPVTTAIASESAGLPIEPRTLTLAMSQSGETADLLNALADRECATPVIALTNNAHSTLARAADGIMICAAGPEIGVAATKTFVCQVIAGAALMTSALVAGGHISAVMADDLVDGLRRMPERLAEALIKAKNVVPDLAEELSDAGGFIFMSRGNGLPYAAEGALKLKELTYRWAEHYPAGELKHGPLALIERGTPVVVVDNMNPKLETNVAEVQARGGRVIRIGPQGSTIPVVGGTQAWGPLESVVPMQILARTLALLRGHDVDKPRNLAKSVTVE